MTSNVNTTQTAAAIENDGYNALIAQYGEEVTDLVAEYEYVEETGQVVFSDDNGRVVFSYDVATGSVDILGPADVQEPEGFMTEAA